MTDYIEREAVLEILASRNAPWDAYQKVVELHVVNFASDVVCKAAYDQAVWERNLAEKQLKSIGKSLGEKMDDVQLVKHGRWIFNKPPDDWIMSLYTCDQCGHVEDGKPNYCPNCGAKMDGEE